MRSVTREDVPAIAELEMELFPGNCFNERTLSREIDAGGGVVIYDGSELIAYLLARWDWSILDITRVGVRAEHQGSGLGTKMLPYDKLIVRFYLDYLFVEFQSIFH